MRFSTGSYCFSLTHFLRKQVYILFVPSLRCIIEFYQCQSLGWEKRKKKQKRFLDRDIKIKLDVTGSWGSAIVICHSDSTQAVAWNSHHYVVKRFAAVFV